jgi:hypothetical protein
MGAGTIINDLPASAQPGQGAILGTPEEMQAMQEAMTAPLDGTPPQTGVTQPTTGGEVVVGGKRYTQQELQEAITANENRDKWQRENTQRAEANAETERRLRSIEDGLRGVLESRQAAQPPPPAEIQQQPFQMPSLPPPPTPPDISTVEGQEAFPAYLERLAQWNAQSVSIAANAARDAAVRDVSASLPGVVRTETQAMTLAETRAANTRARDSFLSPQNLEAVGMDAIAAEELLTIVANDTRGRFAPANGQHFTLDDLNKIASERQGKTMSTPTPPTVTQAVNNVTQTMQAAAAASNVLRSGGGATPSGRPGETGVSLAALAADPEMRHSLPDATLEKALEVLGNMGDISPRQGQFRGWNR